MTEKRFNMEYVHGNTTIWHITDCGEHIPDEKLCDLLNELNDENEQLKKALVELKEIGDYQEGRIKELDKENEQLQEEIKDLNDVLARYEEKYGDVE